MKRPPQRMPTEGWSPAGRHYQPPDPHDPNDPRASEQLLSGYDVLAQMTHNAIGRYERALRANEQDNRRSVQLTFPPPPTPPDATPLQRAREAAGFSPRTLAANAGVDPAEVIAHEREGAPLRRETTAKLAAALAIEPEALDG